MIKISTRDGKKAQLSVADKTLAQFVAEVAEVAGVKPSALQLLTGYPPVLFVSEEPEATLPMGGIKSGETVFVQEGNPPSLRIAVSVGQLVSLGFEPGNAKQALKIGMGCGADLELAVEIAIALSGDLSLTRHLIAADNNCLFSAVLFAIEGSALSTTEYRTPLDLRLAISALVLAAKTSIFDESISEAILGKTPEEYSAWISNEEKWGGEIEMSLICSHVFPQLCIRAVEISTGTVYSYNQEATEVAYLLYDGIHYDLLTRKLEVNGLEKVMEQKLFNPNDIVMLDRAALRVASEARRLRQFVDTGNFSLRCLVCQAGLIGQTDAQQHAKTTGHTNFAEY